jgi:hypothetical protein
MYGEMCTSRNDYMWKEKLIEKESFFVFFSFFYLFCRVLNWIRKERRRLRLAGFFSRDSKLSFLIEANRCQ